MPDRLERRADQLGKGDRLDLDGSLWTVTKAKVKGKRVWLEVDGGRFKHYAMEVKAKARYTVVVETARGQGRSTEERVRKKEPGAGSPARVQASAPGPLLDAAGAMTRWATPDDLNPPKTPKRSSPWKDVAGEDAVLVEELGARLVGVEVEGGKLLVPPVTDATVLGHLLTMHGVRYDGATMAEAKAWAKEHDAGGTSTARQVLDALTLQRAHAIHADLHKDLTAMPTPHWHRERAPR
jgi:hypothetical protein